MLPDRYGHFGAYGGKYVPETLSYALEELTRAYGHYSRDKKYQKALHARLTEIGRPTQLYYAENLTRFLKGPHIYLKREDLCHTGSHKMNNTLGQVLLAHCMGKRRVIAETGAGQHGVATASACALFGIECCVYMGEEDVRRQRLNVFRMELLGAKVVSVQSGTRTLKDAINEAMRDWVTNVKTTYYVIGSVLGPHPYPMMVRDFQSVIGRETKYQMRALCKKLPDCLVACVGGGSNAMGLFYPFFADKKVRMIGVEAGGKGLATQFHGATLCKGKEGVLHGTKSFVLYDKDGQIHPTYSVSAGLDYPGVGPEHAYYKTTGRAMYTAMTDRQALEAFEILSQKEGIIPALESSHALAYVIKYARKAFKRNEQVVVCLSGRGDKDVEEVLRIRSRKR